MCYFILKTKLLSSVCHDNNAAAEMSLSAALLIQSYFRARVVRKKLLAMRRERGAITIQAAWRGYVVRKALLAERRHRAAVTIQSQYRMVVARRAFLASSLAGERLREQARLDAAATVIQSHVRRRAAQKRASLLRAERRKFELLQERCDQCFLFSRIIG